jgi:hypothetical protein
MNDSGEEQGADFYWQCPVCGLEAKSALEMDSHIKDSGHVLEEGEPASGDIGNPDKKD